MKRRIRKYILFTCMLATTIMCLTSTTYAFVLLNDAVEIEAFDLHIDSGDGMLISLDGVRYYNALSTEQLAEIIYNKASAQLTDDERQLKTINLAPATIRHKKNDSGAYVTDIDYNDVNDANPTNMPKSHFLNMDKDTIVLNDGATYNSVFNSHHEFVKANSNKDYNGNNTLSIDFITFDLYFKIDGKYNLGANQGYKLELSQESFLENHNYKYAEGGTNNIAKTVLENDLVSYTVQGGTATAVNYGPKEAENKSIMVDPVNAMRVAFTYEVNDETKIMIIEDENDLSLGSAAVQDRDATDYRHYSGYNAMYTYYNNLWKPAFTSAAYDGDAFKASNYVNTTTDQKIADFVRYQNDSNVDVGYKAFKMTVTIWLEGWDADYFLGIENGLSNFKIWLKFDLEPTATA